jgi:CRP-like cAMP-binding protein
MLVDTQVLETSELFLDVPAFVRETIVSSARPTSFTRGEPLFVIDGPVEETFLLLQGCAKVTQLTKDGEEVVLRIVTPGELVGELGRGLGKTHMKGAWALGESDVLAWATKTFETALVRFPILQRNVNKILARRISEMQNRICRVSTLPASHRVACELLQLSKRMGQRVNGHMEINIQQETLAQMTALNMFHVNRTLSGLEAQGFLRVRRMCIEIRDSHGLSELGASLGFANIDSLYPA